MKRVIIDPGHGGADSGATSAGFKEKDWALDMSLYMTERLEQLGFEVSLTRDSDVTLTSNERTRIIRESGASICLSNHINALNGQAKGAETIHSIHSDGRLATYILDEIEKAGMHRRRVFSKESELQPGRDHYFMHRETGSVQTIIIEYGFIDNPEDREKLKESDYRKKLVDAAIKGLCKYTGVEYSEKEELGVSQTVIIVDKNGEIKEFPKEEVQNIDGHNYFRGRSITELAGGYALWLQEINTAVFNFSDKSQSEIEEEVRLKK